MRAALFEKFKTRYGNAFGYHQSGDGIRCDLNWLLKVVHADHRRLVRDGWPSTGDPVEDSMLGLALQASGSMVAWCGNDPLPAERLPHVPHGICVPGNDLDELTYYVFDWWKSYREIFAASYAFSHTGQCYARPVMLVGDRYNPFTPADDARRLPFTGKRGSCRFLHQAILLAPQRYYVTNATKYGKLNRDVATLAAEIELVQPAQIIALGTEAASMIVRTHNSFRLTCHPQFWHRFRQGREAELAKELSLTKTVSQ